MSDKLKTFWEREVNEIKQHKKRIILLAAVALASLIFWILAPENNEAASNDDVDSGTTTVNRQSSTPKPNSNNNNDSNNSRSTQVLGLSRASEDVSLVNPFKSDLPKPTPVIENKPPVKNEPLPTPALPVQNDLTDIPEPPQELPVNNLDLESEVEPEPATILILKGTAISGDKKMAIIQIGTHNTNDNKNQNLETRIVKIGDTIEGRIITDIEKDFILFNDGQRLNLQMFNQ